MPPKRHTENTRGGGVLPTPPPSKSAASRTWVASQGLVCEPGQMAQGQILAVLEQWTAHLMGLEENKWGWSESATPNRYGDFA